MFDLEKEAVWRFVKGTEPVTENNISYWFKEVMPQMNVQAVLDDMIKNCELFLSNGRYYTTPQKWSAPNNFTEDRSAGADVGSR